MHGILFLLNLVSCDVDHAAALTGQLPSGTAYVQVGNSIVPISTDTIACEKISSLFHRDSPGLISAWGAEEQLLAAAVVQPGQACDVNMATSAVALATIVYAGEPVEGDFTKVQELLERAGSIEAVLSAAYRPELLVALRALQQPAVMPVSTMAFDNLLLDIGALESNTVEVQASLTESAQYEFVAVLFGSDVKFWLVPDALPTSFASLLAVDGELYNRDVYEAAADKTVTVDLSALSEEELSALTVGVVRPGIVDALFVPAEHQEAYSAAFTATTAATIQKTLSLVLPDVDLELDELLANSECGDAIVETLQFVLAEAALDGGFSSIVESLVGMTTTVISGAIEDLDDPGEPGWLEACTGNKPTKKVLRFLRSLFNIWEIRGRLQILADTTSVATSLIMGPASESQTLNLCVDGACDTVPAPSYPSFFSTIPADVTWVDSWWYEESSDPCAEGVLMNERNSYDGTENIYDVLPCSTVGSGWMEYTVSDGYNGGVYFGNRPKLKEGTNTWTCALIYLPAGSPLLFRAGRDCTASSNALVDTDILDIFNTTPADQEGAWTEVCITSEDVDGTYASGHSASAWPEGAITATVPDGYPYCTGWAQALNDGVYFGGGEDGSFLIAALLFAGYEEDPEYIRLVVDDCSGCTLAHNINNDWTWTSSEPGTTVAGGEAWTFGPETWEGLQGTEHNFNVYGLSESPDGWLLTGTHEDWTLPTVHASARWEYLVGETVISSWPVDCSFIEPQYADETGELYGFTGKMQIGLSLEVSGTGAATTCVEP